MTLGTSGVPWDTGATTVDYRNIRHVGALLNFPHERGTVRQTVNSISPTATAMLGFTSSARTENGRSLGACRGTDRDNFMFRTALPSIEQALFTWPTARIAAFNASLPTANTSASGPMLPGPYEVFIDEADHVFVAELGYRAGMFPGNAAPTADATGGRVSVFSLAGELLARWGGGNNPCAAGDFFAPHDIWVDRCGDVYVSEVCYTAGVDRGLIGPDCHTLQKFVRRSDHADAPTHRRLKFSGKERCMRAWRFYGFNDLRLDNVSDPVCRAGHVVVEPLYVQPSVTEAQLACGIPTLAYARIKRRLELEAPVQLFGHEFCARIVEVGAGVSRFRVGDRVAARAKLPCQDCALCTS